VPRPYTRADLKAFEITVGTPGLLILRSSLDQFGQSNIDLTFGEQRSALLMYRFIQGHSNHLLMGLVILHALTGGDPNE